MPKKGSVLMVSLWVSLILAVFAVSLGHRASIGLRLARYQRDSLSAYFLAKAALNKALKEILKNHDQNYDTGWLNNEKEFKDILKDEEKKAYAEVSYKTASHQETFFGIRDEESKINITGLGKEELARLFNLKGGLSPEDAGAFAGIFKEWLSPEKEEDPQKSCFKNAPLSVPQELLLVLEYFYRNKGELNYKLKAQQAFTSVEDFITIYPPGQNKINLNTVSLDIDNIDTLQIFLEITAGDDSQAQCARPLAEEIIRQREAQPDKCFSDISSGFRVDDSCSISDTSRFILKSDYFLVQATGYVGTIAKKISAVYRRDGKLISWQQNWT
jgi:type II secretory pathway component PulK